MVLLEPWRFSLTDVGGSGAWRVEWVDEEGETQRESFRDLQTAIDFSLCVLTARKLRGLAARLAFGRRQ
jgi:hypothetical protein